MIERLCIIGVGLIGGSLALALRKSGFVKEIVGNGRDEAHLRKAVELGVVDRYHLVASQAVAGADMVVVAVPLGAMEQVFGDLSTALDYDAVLTDVGSSKRSVVQAAKNTLGNAFNRFVPGHPIAGTEQSGVEAAFPSLFENRRVILTPTASTDRSACDRVRAMWIAAGAMVEEMPMEHHDDILAATSHLPHMLAFALVDSLARLADHDEVFRYAAGGFRDFTRIASSDPVMWRDVCLANRESLLAAMARFQLDLSEVTAAIDRSDGASLEKMFARAKSIRDMKVAR